MIAAAEERRLLTQSFSNQRREAEAAVVGELKARQTWESQVSALHEELGHAGQMEQVLRGHLDAAKAVRFSEEQAVSELKRPSELAAAGPGGAGSGRDSVSPRISVSCWSGADLVSRIPRVANEGGSG